MSSVYVIILIFVILASDKAVNFLKLTHSFVGMETTKIRQKITEVRENK